MRSSSESASHCHLQHRWIGRGRPVVCPPRSLDLTPMVFFLLSFLKPWFTHHQLILKRILLSILLRQQEPGIFGHTLVFAASSGVYWGWTCSKLVQNTFFFFSSSGSGSAWFPTSDPIWWSVVLQGQISDIQFLDNKSVLVAQSPNEVWVWNFSAPCTTVYSFILVIHSLYMIEKYVLQMSQCYVEKICAICLSTLSGRNAEWGRRGTLHIKSWF